MNLINKIIKEATLERDLKQSAAAKKIITKLKHEMDTDGISGYLPDMKAYYTKIDDIEFFIFDKDSIHELPIARRTVGDEGGYNFRLKHLYLYNSILRVNNGKLEFQINENVLYHELIHYLDYMKGDVSKIKTNKNKSNEKKSTKNIETVNEYINDSHELNAHFFDKIMPHIENLIEQGTEIKQVVKGRGFDFFKTLILQQQAGDSKTIQDYYNDLTPQNKKRFLKRLAGYYQELIKN